MAKESVDIQELKCKSVDEMFSTLYNTYVDELFAFGMHMGLDRSLVKDAIHDVFLALLTKNRTLDHIKDIESYLFRSLNNRIIDLWRGHTDSVGIEVLGSEGKDTADVDKFDEVEIAKRISSCLQSIMERLSYQQRSAIYLRFMCEMRYKKIATILNCTEHAARKFVSKGLANMRKYQPELDVWKS